MLEWIASRNKIETSKFRVGGSTWPSRRDGQAVKVKHGSRSTTWSWRSTHHCSITSISFDPRAARFCSRLSIVRETRFRDPSKNRDSTFARGQSISQALSILFGHFWSFIPEAIYRRKAKERKERGKILREMGIVVEQECKNRFTGSSPFTRSHNRR